MAYNMIITEEFIRYLLTCGTYTTTTLVYYYAF